MTFELPTNRPLDSTCPAQLTKAQCRLLPDAATAKKGNSFTPYRQRPVVSRWNFATLTESLPHCEHSVKAELGLKYAQLGKPSPTVLARCSEMRDSEDQLRLFIDTIPTLAWSARPDGSAQFFNQHWIDYTGIPVEQVLDWGRLKAASAAATANSAGFYSTVLSFFGKSLEQLRGWATSDLIHPEDLPRVIAALTHALRLRSAGR